ncbi:MAG: Hpt domain-containing protein [Erythrobacter sp.]
MAYHSSGFDAALAIAAGDDPSLKLELRAAFIHSVSRQLDLLHRARCDGNWEVAASRLHAIAASFHAPELMVLAEEARASAPGEPTVLQRIGEVVDGLT